MTTKRRPYPKPLPFNGAAFKWWRIMLGISQRDVATKLGVTPDTVCNWEKGRSRPTRPMLARVEKELAVRPGQFTINE